MESRYCPKLEKCPLFNGELLKRKRSEETYKNLYCKEPSANGWKRCKRYLVSEKMGWVPDWVLPNSSYSIDEIQQKMEKST